MPDIRVGGAVGHPYGDADGTRAPANGSVRYYRRHALSVDGVAAGPGSVRKAIKNSVAEWATLDPGEWVAEISLEGPGSTGTRWSTPLVLTEDMTEEILADHVIVELDGNDWAKGDRGKSAYEVAVDNGFVGTEAEWLHSLQVEVSPLTAALTANGLLQIGGPGVIPTSSGLLAIVGFGEARGGLWSVNPIAAMQGAPLTSLWHDPVDGLIYSGFGNWNTNEHTTGIVTHDPETAETRVVYYPRAGEGWPGYTKDGAYTESVQTFFRLRDSIFVPHIDGGGYWEGCGYITNEGGTWHEEPLPGQALHVFSMAETSHGIWAAGSALHENQEDAGPALWFRPDGGDWELAYLEPVTRLSAARYLQVRVEDDRAWVNPYGGSSGDLPERLVRGFRPDGGGGFDMVTRPQGPGERTEDPDYAWAHRSSGQLEVGPYTYYTGPAGRITRELTA